MNFIILSLGGWILSKEIILSLGILSKEIILSLRDEFYLPLFRQKVEIPVEETTHF